MSTRDYLRLESPSALQPRKGSAGFTLVELLVSIVLMLLVTLATISLYSVTSQSYKTVDAGQELNDNARYAFEAIGQSLRIAGYQDYMRYSTEDVALGGKIYPAVCPSGAAVPCPIMGFNNAKITAPTSTTDFGATNNGGINLSDTLAVTFSGSSLLSNAATPDKSIIDCRGVAQPRPTDPADLALSLFWVRAGTNGEPELACTSRDATTGRPRNTEAIVRGVESFQVMYGVDLNADSLPNRWVSAQDVSDWMTVRAVRVGFVLRGPPGSSQGTSTAAVLYPLGQEFIGSSTEAGLSFTPPADSRLRRAYATTFMLRNTF